MESEAKVELHWHMISSCIRNPYTSDIKYFTSDTIHFDGYFYLEDGVMPVERLFLKDSEMYYIEILEKKTVEDTSVYTPTTSAETNTDSCDDDDDFGNICFFPTAIIQLKYRLIKKLDETDDFKQICERIVSLEPAVEIKNRTLKAEREEKERQDLIERYKTFGWDSLLK